MKQKTSGSGLIFAVVLLFVILGMVITLSSVTMLETKMNQKTKSSVGAFYGSESGVEWALNQIATKPGANQLSTIPGFTTNVASCPSGVGTCKVYFLDSNGKVLASTATIDQVKAVRSVGTQGDDTQRAIEAAVASGGDIGYYKFNIKKSSGGYYSEDQLGIGRFSGTLGSSGSGTFTGNLTCGNVITENRSEYTPYGCGYRGLLRCDSADCAWWYSYYKDHGDGLDGYNYTVIVSDLSIVNVSQLW